MKTLLHFLFISAMFFRGLAGHAAVPSAINYQGRLTNAGGVPQPGVRTMIVRIYDSATNGRLLFSETIGNVTVDANGIYGFNFGANGESGSGTLASALSNSIENWLELTVDGVPQTPRQKLLAVPFAMVAGRLPNNTVTSQMIADGAIDTAKITGLGPAATASAGQTGLSVLATGTPADARAAINAVGYEQGTLNSVTPNSIRIRSPYGDGLDTWEIFNTGANYLPDHILHTVPSAVGRNNWSHLTTWNVRFDAKSRSWWQAVNGQQMQAIELGTEGISLHMVKDKPSFPFNMNSVAHMVWAIRPTDLHAAGGPGSETGSYQNNVPVLQRKISDICIFRNGSTNGAGWLDPNNPFCVYISDSGDNTVPPRGSLDFRTWSGSAPAQFLNFDRAGGNSLAQTRPEIGDEVGGMRFRVWDGTAWVVGAKFRTEVDSHVEPGTANLKFVMEGRDSAVGDILSIKRGEVQVASVARTGVARFSTLNVEDWPTYADEEAAKAGGLNQFDAYKTPTGELRYLVGENWDIDATAYFASLAAALGGPITKPQKSAINAFITEEKSTGRWTKLKRLYFPIWNHAAANAIDMVSRTTGSFLGGVTPAWGYIQGNGKTGYFDTKTTASGLGLSPDSAFIFALISRAGTGTATQAFVGAYPAGTGDLLFTSTDTSLKFECMSNTQSFLTISLPRQSQNGVLTASRFGGFHTIRKRTATGVTPLGNSMVATAGNVPATSLFAMAYNSFGNPAGFSDACFGAFGIGSGLTIEETDALTLKLKTVWEACSGLTLP